MYIVVFRTGYATQKCHSCSRILEEKTVFNLSADGWRSLSAGFVFFSLITSNGSESSKQLSAYPSLYQCHGFTFTSICKSSLCHPSILLSIYYLICLSCLGSCGVRVYQWAFTLIFTPTGNFEFSVHLTCMSLNCGRKVEHWEQTHNDKTKRRHHRERVQLGWWFQTQDLDKTKYRRWFCTDCRQWLEIWMTN